MADDFEIEAESIDSVSVPRAPYISPYISLDLDTNKAVIQIRDSDTGDVVRQFPTERSLRLRSAEAAAREAASKARSSEGNNVQLDTSNVKVPDAVQAQIASVALSTGAQTGVQQQSAGVSVLA